MGEKSELQHIPRAVDALVLSEARSSLIARGRSNAKSLLARKPEPLLRARVKLNGKWGLIDKTGRLVVEPFCCEICDFSCGMAAFSDVPVQRNRKLYQRPIEDFYGRQDKQLEYSSDYCGYCLGNWGFVDVNWRIAIPARFKRVRNFSENMAGVSEGAKWGFLSNDGCFAIQPRFEAVGDFSGGLCVAKLNGKYGFIDRRGEFVIKPSFSYLWDFSEGLACAEIDKKYCFIDRTGEIVISPIFDSAEDFVGGVAQAELNGKSCIIDPSGSVIFTYSSAANGLCPNREEKVGSFIDGVALVSGSYCDFASKYGHNADDCNERCLDEECSWNYGYYIDKAGEPIPMPEGLIGIGDFSEGLGLIGKLCYRWETGMNICRFGFIDNLGVVKIAPQFNSAESFTEGTARVFTDEEEWRLIDKEGNLVDDPNKESTDSQEGDELVKDGLVSIEVNGLYGFEDETGRVVIEPKFAWLDYFSNGMARFNTSRFRDGKWGFIDKTGKMVISPQFEEAQDFETIFP
jgi:hypothetical protein